MPNYYQGLVPFLDKKKILRSNRYEKMQKQNNDVFFIQLVNAVLNFTNNNFPTPTVMEKSY